MSSRSSAHKVSNFFQLLPSYRLFVFIFSVSTCLLSRILPFSVICLHCSFGADGFG